MKTLLLCADDLGQNPAIDEACLHLFELGRLSAASVLSEAPHAATHQQALRQANDKGLQLGLHFNLTLPFQDLQPKKNLATWIIQSQLQLVDTVFIKKSLLHQLQLFEDLFLRPPNFVDGHQHVHQFKQIRDVLIQTLCERYPSHQWPWLRSTALSPKKTRPPHYFNCLVLEILGGKKFVPLLKKQGFSCNPDFLGVYDFRVTSENAYRELMVQWLSVAENQTLMMCHPAKVMFDDDPHGSCRVFEYLYFKSESFLEDLHQNKIQLAKSFL